MSWFRKKNSYANPTNDYLTSPDTVGRPLAIVFIVLMVFVLAAVIFSLFLGGRWLYKNLDGKSTTTTTVVTEQSQTDTSNQTNGQGSTSGSNNSTGTNQNTTTAPSPPSTSTTTVSQPTPTSLPNTGPEPE